MDYSDKKVLLLGIAAVGTTLLTLCTAYFAKEGGDNVDQVNFAFMVFIKLLQGAVTALIPPGLNSITQGIVGSVGMTGQVAMNEMMNHLGTAIIVFSGSMIAYFLFPNIGLLFLVSPLACVGVVYFLMKIRPGDIDHNAARGLKPESETTTRTESFDGPGKKIYSPPSRDTSGNPIQITPSFNLGGNNKSSQDGLNTAKADTPLHILKDPVLLVFIIICFTFHLSNGTVLPLVMQTLAIGNGRSGIVMSGFCIIIAQACMVASANICGKYSGLYGRKGLFLVGILSVPIRCAILAFLLMIKASAEGNDGNANYYNDDDGNGEGAEILFIDMLVLSTQVLDGVGAGIFGTMYVLVTSDISGGTGRFSLTLGLTTAAMSIGGTVSGYLGQALAEDIGYRQAFVILGFMSLIPAVLYFFCMPETLSAEEESKNRAESSAMDNIAEDEFEAVGESKLSTTYGQLA